MILCPVVWGGSVSGTVQGSLLASSSKTKALKVFFSEAIIASTKGSPSPTHKTTLVPLPQDLFLNF